MVFTPEEVAGRTFVAALRGYDKVEVDSFLRAVAADYAELTGEVQALRARLDETTRELHDIKPEYRQAVWEGSEARTQAAELRTELARVALAVALVAHTVRRAAEKDADAIRDRAEQRAQTTVALAERSAAAIVLHASSLRRAVTDGTLDEDEADQVAQMLAAWRSEQQQAFHVAVAAVDDVRRALVRQRDQLGALTDVGVAVPQQRRPADDEPGECLPADVTRAG